ncbi:protein CHUP1, chloroplastic-like [Senna tora]|uniref:Protein CHUP1, chloroplastic-like n=1 Tax=Senna tora TaxID=362788 RepID=A0A834W3G4_9FABA|nr:protein CHUP1, chloroplastic-like [Senna tora]
MENTAFKAQVVKPVILKAGIPLALSLAGIIYAWIKTKKSLCKASSLTENEFDNDSPQASSMEDDEQQGMALNTSLEQEIIGLRSRIEGLQMKELALRLQFDRYCDMKEKESLLMEIRNLLSLETARVEFLDKEVSSMEAQNKKLESFLAQYLRIIGQLEDWKSENRIDVINELEDEMRELHRVLEELQEEKNELVKKLDAAEKSYASKIEAGDVSKEEYKQVVNEVEQLKKERGDEVKELIYLRWNNACLRHELMRQHEQQKNEHIEVECEGSGGVIHYDELDHSPLEHEHHNMVCFGAAHTHSDGAYSKRKKLIKKLKRWVEGSEKARVKPEEKGRFFSASYGTEETKTPARRSCSSA